MWYSATKVGILEIDMDHHNIDLMLQLYFSGNCPDSSLRAIVEGLCSHFVHEEEIITDLGHTFPKEHLQEHQELTKSLIEMMGELEDGTLEGMTFAETVREILLLHVDQFDAPLGKLSN